ncbi:putative carbonic anhydrase 3 [Malaya genurostris]|uniref:putative carbonic anhydrase 3 n=1 Tax=Malaya genurostris TaxID=325434 RepID=UPI0026F39121|nr:putative carbonic anhydrase 3 [Malaya genurostris]XP_058444999.1 putative carbonic anhydrase 3 [Malaya genurostris]XP_058445000.1 putative carbonic anhydrase 3 [Malaya genurostris]XP_058445001.1 putative carbonic anhydrase 3 [Malaya genurostris]
MFNDIVVVLLRILLLGVSLSACLADSWRYPTPGPDGTIGEPEDWGENCDFGKRQSPIDITYKAAVKGSYSEFIFQNYDKPLVNASLVNTGHTIQINLDDASTSIYGGGLRSKYFLEQLHFHWNSEHTIDGTRYALELHLVHHHSKFNSVAEAATTKAGVAVVAVLFHVNEHSNLVLSTILNATEEIKSKINERVQLRDETSLEELLPKNRSVYFRYEGSLTTPVCAESVVWTVFPESLPLSLAQLEEFKTVHDLDDNEMLLNYRPVQALNARVLVLVSDADIPVDSGASSRWLAEILPLTVIVSFLTIVTARLRW